MISILGYLATFCLVIAALPQAIKSIKDGHSNGIASGFIILLIAGFGLMSLFLLLTKPIIPLMLNYLGNTIMMSIIGYYKLFPRVRR